MPFSPKQVPTRPIMPGHVAVAEQRDVVLELEVEAVPPRLQQVRAVAAAERRADHAHALVAADQAHAHEIGEVARLGAARLGQLDPALLGDGGRVDRVDLLLGVAGEHAEQDLDRERAGVALGDPPEQLDVDAVDARPLAERHGQPPELARERQERAQHLHVLGRDGGDVDRARDHAAGERGDDLLGGLEAGAIGRLGGRGARGAA